jgi:hypothetical protein
VLRQIVDEESQHRHPAPLMRFRQPPVEPPIAQLGHRLRDVDPAAHHPKRHLALISAAGYCRAVGLTRDGAIPTIRDVFRRCCPGTCCRDQQGNAAKTYTWEQALARLDDVYARYPASEAPVQPAAPTGDEADSSIREQRVAFEVDRLRVKHRARALFEVELRGPAPPFDAGTLAEVLARPEEPPYRIEGFLPSGGRLLNVAQRKTGKTTLGLNLGKALIDGKHFLGRFAVRPITGNVAVLNYEVTGRQLAWWAQQVGIPGDRLILVNLRGRRNPLDHHDDQAKLVELLRRHQTEVLLVDPFGRAYTDKSQNDPGEVTYWLAELDRFAVDIGASELILNTHAGWVGERSRGASALEDWPDAVVTLTKDDHDGARYLRAFGRDVEVDEDRLHFEPATRTLTLTGMGNRKQSQTERAVAAVLPDVLDYVREHPECSGEEIRTGVDGTDSVIVQARRLLTSRAIPKPLRTPANPCAPRLEPLLPLSL